MGKIAEDTLKYIHCDFISVATQKFADNSSKIKLVYGLKQMLALYNLSQERISIIYS